MGTIMLLGDIYMESSFFFLSSFNSCNNLDYLHSDSLPFWINCRLEGGTWRQGFIFMMLWVAYTNTSNLKKMIFHKWWSIVKFTLNAWSNFLSIWCVNFGYFYRALTHWCLYLHWLEMQPTWEGMIVLLNVSYSNSILRSFIDLLLFSFSFV